MSEVEARAPATRGRSSHRGGRGGFGRGGARGGRKFVNGSNKDETSAQFDDSLDDQGELGEMKKKYASELLILKDMFPDWTDVDLVFALHETDGDIPSTVDHITQGNVSQFAEVKSTKDRARSKVKENTPLTTTVGEKSAARGGRGRGAIDNVRGSRGRGSDRSRGGQRGGRGGHAPTDSIAKEASAVSVPTAASAAWESTTVAPAAAAEDVVDQDTTKDLLEPKQSTWGNVVTADSAPATASEGAKSSLIPEGGPKKSWASMFAPKPAAQPAERAVAKQPAPTEMLAAGHIPPAPDQIIDEVPAQVIPPAPPVVETPEVLAPPEAVPPTFSGEASELVLTPSKDPLTEENVEHLPDESHPPATQTVASTAGSLDPRNLTPMPMQQLPIGRPPLGGFATSANRATGSMRSVSFQRRVQEQQEAVVMPGHNAMDRAAVQFGSMGLNGEPGPDVDEDREEPETRQAPQHSPPSQPRTSLPPVARQAATTQEISEALPTTKQAPGLPPATQQNQHQMQEAASNQAMQNETSHMAQSYHQYGRYGQQAMHQEPVAQQQKPYDSFSHQAQPSQYDQFSMQSQQMPQHHQQQSHAGFGGLSSAPTDASSLYATDHQRNAYHQYYGGHYGPQELRGQPSQHEPAVGQQRSASGFGTGPNESAYLSQAQAQQQQTQSRYGDSTDSGHNTPNPPMSATQQQQAGNSGQPQQSLHQVPNHQQQSGYGASHAGFPYGHPYYNSPYQQAYNNQFGYQPQVGGYGGAFPGKGGIYGTSPSNFNMNTQSFDQHSSSPANTGAFGQGHQSSGRSTSGMSGLGASLEDYGRGSAQPHQQGAGFVGMNDSFARSASGFGGQGYAQQASTGQDEALKPLNDGKSGPSPALSQPGRPGSATNSAGNSNQSSLPQPQGHQSSFGNYPGFQGQSQYGLGGLGSQQPHGQSTMGGQGYGSYGAGGFGQTYGSYNSRGGWGSNYGAH